MAINDIIFVLCRMCRVLVIGAWLLSYTLAGAWSMCGTNCSYIRGKIRICYLLLSWGASSRVRSQHCLVALVSLLLFAEFALMNDASGSVPADVTSQGPSWPPLDCTIIIPLLHHKD